MIKCFTTAKDINPGDTITINSILSLDAGEDISWVCGTMFKVGNFIHKTDKYITLENTAGTVVMLRADQTIVKLV
jgi:hypothetical protein